MVAKQTPEHRKPPPATEPSLCNNVIMNCWLKFPFRLRRARNTPASHCKTSLLREDLPPRSSLCRSDNPSAGHCSHRLGTRSREDVHPRRGRCGAEDARYVQDDRIAVAPRRSCGPHSRQAPAAQRPTNCPGNHICRDHRRALSDCRGSRDAHRDDTVLRARKQARACAGACARAVLPKDGSPCRAMPESCWLAASLRVPKGHEKGGEAKGKPRNP